MKSYIELLAEFQKTAEAHRAPCRISMCADGDYVLALCNLLAEALSTVKQLEYDRDRSEHDFMLTIAQRDRYEENITEIAQILGCQEEWSNMHSHVVCISDWLRARDSEDIQSERKSFDSLWRVHKKLNRQAMQLEGQVDRQANTIERMQNMIPAWFWRIAATVKKK